MRRLAVLVVCIFLGMPVARIYGGFSYHITEFSQYNGINIFYDSFSDGIEPPSTPDPGVHYNVVASGLGADRETGGTMELNGEDAIVVGDVAAIGIGLESLPHFFTPGSAGYVIGEFDLTDGFYPESCFGIHLGLWPEAVDADMLIYTDSYNVQYAVWGSPASFDDFTALTSGLGRVDITADLEGASSVTLELALNDVDQVTALFDYGSDGTYDLTIPNFATLELNPVIGTASDLYSSGTFFAAEPAVVPAPSAIVLSSLGIGVAGCWRHRNTKSRSYRS